jgi:hypothetical protein
LLRRGLLTSKPPTEDAQRAREEPLKIYQLTVQVMGLGQLPSLV